MRNSTRNVLLSFILGMLLLSTLVLAAKEKTTPSKQDLDVSLQEKNIIAELPTDIVAPTINCSNITNNPAANETTNTTNCTALAPDTSENNTALPDPEWEMTVDDDATAPAASTESVADIALAVEELPEENSTPEPTLSDAILPEPALLTVPEETILAENTSENMTEATTENITEDTVQEPAIIMSVPHPLSLQGERQELEIVFTFANVLNRTDTFMSGPYTIPGDAVQRNIGPVPLPLAKENPAIEESAATDLKAGATSEPQATAQQVDMRARRNIGPRTIMLSTYDVQRALPEQPETFTRYLVNITCAPDVCSFSVPVSENGIFKVLAYDAQGMLLLEDSFSVEIGLQRTKQYLAYGNNRIIAEDNQGTVQYHHQDNLGSTVLITNASGEMVAEFSYGPFGEPLVDPAQFAYTEKEYDASGLFYYGARYYDADIGRFTTADTFKGRTTEPASLNRYVYVQNNPLVLSDPTGHEGEHTTQQPVSTRVDTSVDYARMQRLAEKQLKKLQQQAYENALALAQQTPTGVRFVPNEEGLVQETIIEDAIAAFATGGGSVAGKGILGASIKSTGRAGLSKTIYEKGPLLAKYGRGGFKVQATTRSGFETALTLGNDVSLGLSQRISIPLSSTKSLELRESVSVPVWSSSTNRPSGTYYTLKSDIAIVPGLSLEQYAQVTQELQQAQQQQFIKEMDARVQQYKWAAPSTGGYNPPAPVPRWHL
ncbi:MAG: RHS repeat-associated core domain-containing protein [archaeon]